MSNVTVKRPPAADTFGEKVTNAWIVVKHERIAVIMSDLRKRLAKSDLDTETENETGNQDSDAVSKLTSISSTGNYPFCGVLFDISQFPIVLTIERYS